MQLVLFDWCTDGHHPRYVRRFAEALSNIAVVSVAVPAETAEHLSDLPIDLIPLASSRPPVNPSQPVGPQNKELADAELELFREVAGRTPADHLLHLHADPIIRRLVRCPPFRKKVSLLFLTPRAHYPSLYRTPLSAKERLRAWFQEYLIGCWTRRAEAHALLTLDKEAANLWSITYRTRAFFIPEPYVEKLPTLPKGGERSGCIIYGALAPRKGIDLLAQAVALKPNSMQIVLAGSVDPAFKHELDRNVSMMREAGAAVDLRNYIHSEMEGLDILAKARCAVLPYPRHYGMSRVLVEACSVGTPVIAHNSGLIGHLVRRHGLGVAVDCKDQGAFREALITFTQGSRNIATYSDNLAQFAARFSKSAFEHAATAPFATSA